MIIFYLITLVLAGEHPPVDWAADVTHWAGHHVFLTILILLITL